MAYLLGLYRENQDDQLFERLPEAISRCGYIASRDNSNYSSVSIWNPNDTLNVSDNIHFTNGWRIKNLWLGHGRSAIAILPQRIYFRNDNSIIRRPEREIIDLSKKPNTPFGQRLKSINELHQAIQSIGLPSIGKQIDLEEVETGLTNETTYVVGDRTFPSDTKLSSIYQPGGFFRVPENLDLLIVADSGVSQNIINTYHRKIEQGMHQCKSTINIFRTTIEKLEQRLNELQQGDSPKKEFIPVLLVFSSSPPSTKAMNAMRALDFLKIPWRRAYSTDNHDFSIRSQLGSILQAAGGIPHAVQLAGGESLPWSIGIDLSHRPAFSRVCSTLISPNGNLVKAWTIDQSRNEEVDATVLRQLIKSAVSMIPSNELQDGVLIMRDGRLFERENPAYYLDEVDGPVTLIEIRKYNNPPIILDNADNLPPTTPSVGWLPKQHNTSIGFLVTLPQSLEDNFDFVLKIHIKDKWDGMQIGRSKLAHILAAQTKSPTLGLNTSKLPAPIYWADGIAGGKGSDGLNFGGQNTIASLKRT